MSVEFQRKLNLGKVGESVIANWFISRGYSVLPVYEKELGSGKGPVLYTTERTIKVAPDMFVFNANKMFWVEAKNKSTFSWHYITKRWVTGIDKHHFYDYLYIARSGNIPCWLFFLHQSGNLCKNAPPGLVSPSGLYAGEIEYLNKKINHTHENHGRHGMVYWAHESLKPVSSLDGMSANQLNLF